MAKHFEAPFWIEKDRLDDFVGYRIMSSDGIVGMTHTEAQVRITPEEEANAWLLGASASLLEALKDIVPEVPQKDAFCHYGLTDQAHCGYCQRIIKARAAIAFAETGAHLDD